MELFIIRHSTANAIGDQGDHDRTLSKEGLERIDAVAKGLKAMGLQPDVILTSPAVRTLQTAQALQKVLEVPKTALVECPSLAIGGSAEEVMEAVNQKYSLASQIFLVGHEPNLTELISLLTTGSTEMGIKVGRASVTCLQVYQQLQTGRATLLWKMTAKQVAVFGNKN